MGAQSSWASRGTDTCTEAALVAAGLEGEGLAPGKAPGAEVPGESRQTGKACLKGLSVAP